MSSYPEYTQLSRYENFHETTDALETLRNIQMLFPINELTKEQWSILECVADGRRPLPIHRVTTFQFNQRVEYCADNGVHLLVTRYLEVNPHLRQIHPKKTVQVLPSMYPVEMYLKNYSSVLKL
ncbi:hypothetical protein GCK72_008690 [Caenorhabditis remanei]|uniref:Uncharacterized protein n=1 Tax=Caenorhabditis remanei TaxID=31234 RepID=A0A6A5H0B1_CAERE|nr:hypothetical protein GCK72_008690 [Caenorhabditis remanei]KAF1760441.1 hypothetical protein GCK72_008690 [Caenorhabditis remanei]